MKHLLFTYLLIAPFWCFSQNNNWQEFSDEEIIILNMNDTKAYHIENLKFNVTWDSKLSYSDNIGYYGGIKELHIYGTHLFKLQHTFARKLKSVASGVTRFAITIEHHSKLVK